MTHSLGQSAICVQPPLATDATTYRCFADHDARHFNAFDRRLVVGVVDHARNFVLEYA